MATKKQIADGTAEFIEARLLPRADGKRARLALRMAAEALRSSPDTADPFLRNPLVASVMREEDGEYDAESLAGVLSGAVGPGGLCPVTVPGIPLIAPEGAAVHISAEDIGCLLGMVQGKEEPGSLPEQEEAETE